MIGYAVFDFRDTVSDVRAHTSLASTPFPAFDPPRNPSGMQAVLEHSLQNYGPLLSDLRPRRARSRVNSRPSPYPRTVETSFTSSVKIVIHVTDTCDCLQNVLYGMNNAEVWL